MEYNIKCTVSYDGTNYMGYQVQDDLPTIQKELQKAIFKVTKEDNKIYASGRTDRAVHAFGQVINFITQKNIIPKGWLNAINAYLPDDIRIVDVKIVDLDFHARFSAIKKEYRYYILHNKQDLFKRNYMLMQSNLDIDLMNEALQKLIGIHDFKGFCSGSIDKRKETVKQIYEAKINVIGDVLEFVFVSNGFLRYQIRKMMGTIIEIGTKKAPLSVIDKIFDTCDPRVSNKMVSGCGLYLYEVFYKE